MSQSIIQVLLRGIDKVMKSRDSTFAGILCCIICATVLMFTSTAGAYTYTYTDGVFTGSFRVSGTAVDPNTGLINTDPNSEILLAYTLVDGNWGPWSNTSALTVDSYSFSGLGYTFSMAVDHPAPNSVGVYVNHQGQIVDWSWTIYDGAWPNDTVAYLYLYGGPANVGNSNPRPDQENLYVFKPSPRVVRYTNTGTWTGRADNYAYYAGVNGGFGKLNLDTGNYTPLGTSKINNQPVELAGLGVFNGTLYGAPYVSSPKTAPLYSVDPSNGSLTLIGGAFDDFGGFGSTMSGLYALTGGNTAYLLAIDPATGAVTGGPWPTTTQRGTLWDLSTNSSTLYYAGNNHLWTLNTSNGSTEAVTAFSAPVFIGPMVEEDGTLYGINGNYKIYTIDPTTGLATFKADIVFPVGTTPEVCVGLAPYPLLPSSLSVAKSGAGSGTVTSSPSGITCGTTCSASFASGTSVTLTPTPDPGSYFLIWSTPCSGSTLCSLTVNNSTEVTATFGLQAPTYYDTVQRVYIGYYQRPADPVGLLYWAERLAATNGNLNDIIEAYANSAESQALYGTINSTNIANVIDAIYMALFNRHAEAGGLAWYINGFDSGQYTAATIMLNVLYGAQNEDLTTLTNKLAASNLFTRAIDPELGGLNFQVTYAGNQDASAARTFLASVTDDGTTIPTQDAMTTWMKNNIANPGDPILSQ
jgi:hypothetical protein